MKFQIYMDANFFSNSHSFAYSNGIARTENTYVKAARKLFRAASNKDERDTMSLKRPRNIEVKIIDYRTGRTEDPSSGQSLHDSRNNQTQDEREGERLVRQASQLSMHAVRNARTNYSFF